MKRLNIKACTDSIDLEPNTELHRYFSGEWIEDLFKKKKLYFRNTKNQRDQYERMIPSSFIKNECGEGYKKIADMKQTLVESYISCWTKSKADNYAFWKIYGNASHGKAIDYADYMIATTYGKLKTQFDNSVVFYEVEYIDPNIDESREIPRVFFDASNQPNSILATEKYKIFPYLYEEEVRAVVYSHEKKDGISLLINPEKIIDHIIISPFANEEMQKRTEAVIKKHFNDMKIRTSTIKEND